MPEIEYSDSGVVLRLKELQQETDRECVLELIAIYCEEAPKLMRAIADALQSGIGRDLALAAHTLKGSSLNLGAHRMGGLCLKLEEQGRSGKPISPSEYAGEISAEFERLKAVFDLFRQEKA